VLPALQEDAAAKLDAICYALGFQLGAQPDEIDGILKEVW
jgi:hypothetical protein